MSNEFKEHCVKLGIHLHRYDYKFIKESISKLPYDKKRCAVRGYCDEWIAGMSEVNKSFSKQNYGRFRANSFLRKKIEFLQGKNNGN